MLLEGFLLGSLDTLLGNAVGDFWVCGGSAVLGCTVDMCSGHVGNKQDKTGETETASETSASAIVQ